MKKLLLGLAAIAVISMVALPALAATQWNFGASLRYTTFWTEQDAGKGQMMDFNGGGRALDSDGKLDWGTAPNTQIQMRMKSDSLEGYIELGYNFDGNSVWTREIWGKYKFNDAMSITIGQQHQLFNQFISNQVWGPDLNMNGIGTAFKPPTPKITLTYGGEGGPFGSGFNFALNKPFTGRVSYLRNTMAEAYLISFAGPPPPGMPVAWNGTTDTDAYLPQLQASYQYYGDAWRIKLAGAYQYLKLNKLTSSYTLGGLPFILPAYYEEDKGINSWLVGIDGDINFGPLYLAAGVSFGQNWSDAGWNDETGCIDSLYTTGYLSDNFGIQARPTLQVGPGGPYAKVSWKNTNSIQASLVAAYRLTEALRFEVGGGYRYDDNKYFENNSNIWNVYLQAAYTIAPGFTITPEIGFVDFGKEVFANTDNDKGYLWYAGAKWQMDF